MTLSGALPNTGPAQDHDLVCESRHPCGRPFCAAYRGVRDKPMSEYADYPGGEKFEPWQDHEWPFHCGVPATYVGEVGERELAVLANGVEMQTFLREHDVLGGDPPITLDMVPPHAPSEGEAWDSTIHHFHCTKCRRDLLLWDAN
jgi:uncharacterized protein CbrC (UPF0167 family)